MTSTTASIGHASALALAAVATVAVAGLASARSGAPAAGDGLSQCQRAVSRIGAQLGHTVRPDADGHETYVFVVRSDGGEYAVHCDARTGSLGAIDRLARTGPGATEE